jgi:hypothetical protein
MLKYGFRIILYLTILCFGCQHNTTVAEIQIDAEDQTFTISNSIREGAIIGQIESTSSGSVKYFLLNSTFSHAFSLDSISGELFLANVSILKELHENGFELEVLISRSGNYIEHGVITNIIIKVINDNTYKHWDSREQQAHISDALVNSLYPTLNYKAPFYYKASAWTNNLQASITRTYLKFDLTAIPQGANILNAKLSLFSPSDSTRDLSHSTLSGTNEFFVRRVTSEWDPQTITWHSQPEYSTHVEVISGSSLTHDQDYEIDITTIVRSIIETDEENYGFLIMLKQESFYRQICFASNNYHDHLLRPLLQIKYE